ncbi:MAG: glycosyltransferase family 2 protein [bacterium]
MLSILIPTYNYNAFPLAQILEKQALESNIEYEIICLDDASNGHLEENLKINGLKNGRFDTNTENLGSILNRKKLAEEAKFDWVLFVDADTSPKSPNYLSNYIKFIDGDKQFVFGGFTYRNIKHNPTNSLRYYFGKQREEVPSKKRNERAYKITISANFLCEKTKFLNLIKKVSFNNYGLDYLFGALLKENDVKVYHIDNEVLHNGLDQNEAYLTKINKSLETLKKLLFNNLVPKNDISLLKVYNSLKKVGLIPLVIFSFKICQNQLKNHLLFSKKPSMLLLSFYKLGYFSTIK